MTELAAFHDELFPLAVSFGATGGPERAVEVVTLQSGRERRNARTAHGRRRYDAGTGLRSIGDLYDVLSFFEARRGSLHAFRFRDPFDMRSGRPDAASAATDQVLGAGDGARTRWPLVKRYGAGADAYLRPIRKPASDTLEVAVNGAALAPGAFAFDDATGEVVLAQAPAAGAAVTAGYEFHVPVRFDAERLEISLAAFEAGRIPTIPLIEVRP